jgi:hypothetical protein
MPDRRLVGFDSHARGDIARDDQLVAKLPGLSRGRVDADVRCDAAENDRPHATLSQFGVEVGAEERAPGRLGDQNIAWLRKAGSEVGKTARQDLRQRRGLIDLALGASQRRLNVHQHHWRPCRTKSLRQRLAALEQFIGRDRGQFAAEDAVLQVDQHKGG